MKRLVIGCGFLGLPLAKKWAQKTQAAPNNEPTAPANLESSHHAATPPETWGTTRSKERAESFQRLGVTPLVCDVTDSRSMNDAFSDLPEMDTIVFAVGMDRSRYRDIRNVYVKGLERFFAAYSHPINHFIYISSTGVFGSFDGQWIDESAPTVPSREGGKACLEAEQLIAQKTDQWTVLRMAGLYGGDRVPTQQTIADKNWAKLSPAGYLNLIHQTDAVNAIAETAIKKPVGEIIHCSDGRPPIRKDYYQYIADQFGLGKIPWSQNATVDPNTRSANSKRISNEKMLTLLKLDLIHSDYKSGLAEAFEA